MFENWIQMVVIGIMIAIIIYLIMNIFNTTLSKEGFITNPIDILGQETKPIESTAIESVNSTILAKITKLDDELMLKKYKKQYETTIINLDDYINLLIMQQIIGIKLDSGIKTTTDSLERLNTLKASKDSLNVAMKYLDKL